MKKILVPCDFSISSVSAFRFALNIAEKSRGSIHLIHVIELPVLHDTMLMPALYFEQAFLDDLKAKAEKNFQELTEKYQSEKAEITNEVRYGVVQKEIVEFANSQKMDLIVMGSHGVSGIEKFFVGSNAERIVRSSSVPVLVLKDFYEEKIDKIALPYSMEIDGQEEFVMKVSQLQKFFNAHIELVWINTPGFFQRDLDMLKRMGAFAKKYQLSNFTIHVFSDFTERDGIMNFTDTINGNLIAMATHGRKGLAHLINGSIAESVVKHVKWPIWTYLIK
jgi:nucleotide-binding universal stress UspA family protein